MMQQLLSALPLPAYACDAEGRITCCNAQAILLWGRTPRLLDDGERYSGALRLWHADGSPQPHDQSCVAVALREGRSHIGEMILERPDGQRRRVLARVQLLRDERGRITGVVNVMQDGTAQPVVEADMRAVPSAAERGLLRLQSVFANLADGVVVSDIEGNLIDWNPAALRLHGYASVDEVRRHLSTFTETFEFLLPDGGAIPYSEWPVARLLRGEPVSNYELRVRRKDIGVEWYIRYDGVIVADPAGGPGLVVLSLHDLTVERRAQAELRRTGNLLRAVVDGTTDAVFVKDLEGRYLLVNEAGARITGKQVADVLGKADAEFLEAESARIVREHDLSVMRSGQADTGEERLVTAGVARTFLAAKAPYRDADGKVIGVVGVSRDITDRSRGEARLRDSEDRYRRLLEVLPDAVLVNSGGVVTFCNPAFLRLVGASAPEQVLGKKAIDFFHRDYHAAIRARVDAMLTGGEAVPPMQERILRRDGRAVPVDVVATPIKDRGEMSILVAMHDLTERERSLELLRSVQGSVTDAILTIDASGTIRSANPATEHLFGYRPDELVGRDLGLLMPTAHRRAYPGYLDRYLRTGEARIVGSRRELEARRRDGVVFPIELTVTEFHLSGVRHFTGVVRDITARRRLEAQLLQAQKMEAIGRLAGGVAHDFNNLLTVINGHCEMLLARMPPDDNRRAGVRMIHDAGSRATRLTRQLLAFSRKAVISPQVIDLNVLAAESQHLLQRLIGEDIDLAMTLAPQPLCIEVDPSLVEQALLNVVVNARDAMPTGGRITIETCAVTLEQASGNLGHVPPGSYVQLSVTDTGCGMTEAVKVAVFEPFFTTKAVGKGTGLGLAVVHGVMQQSGGYVSVYSEVGIGSTFRLLFPAAEAGLAPLAPEPVGTEPVGTETVLLVEDEAGVRDVARSALQSFGYTVLEADSGAAALELARHHDGRIDLLLSDVVMPEMGGGQLAAALRQQLPDLLVLFVSGYTDDAVVRHGVIDATEAFLSKPFTPLALAQKVRSVLDAR